MNIDAKAMHFKDLNAQIRDCADRQVVIDNCLGQRYIGTGLNHKDIIINGLPGNALGAYLDGSQIIVNGSTQEATGDKIGRAHV